MLIAKYDFDRDTVLSLCQNYEGMCDYVWTLVPEEFKHLDAVYHNTRYYISMKMLTDKELSYAKKQQLNDVLTKDIHTVGYVDSFISCDELMKFADDNKINKYYKGAIQ